MVGLLNSMCFFGCVVYVRCNPCAAQAEPTQDMALSGCTWHLWVKGLQFHFLGGVGVVVAIERTFAISVHTSPAPAPSRRSELY